MDKIDKIFVINLDSEPDRLKKFMEEIERMGISPEKVERFRAIPIRENAVGCALSHLEVLKLGRGYKNVLIFEDDFMFLVSRETLDKNLNDFFSLDLDWRTLMLSYKVNDPNHPKNTGVVVGITNDCYSASGYLVNSKYIEELIWVIRYGTGQLIITGEHWNFANDRIWRCLQRDDRWFYLLERCGKQRPFIDSQGNIVEYDC